MASKGKRPGYPSILYIPDTQAKQNTPLEHLQAVGRYALDKRPDYLIHAGDLGDFPSLGLYDSIATRGFEQKDYKLDLEAANQCADLLLRPIRRHNAQKPKRRQYHPRCIVTLGNHENRIIRAAKDQPWLRGVLLDQLNYADFGWEVIPFLQPIIIENISFCHFFCRNAKGQVVQSRRGMPSAMAQVVREGMSAVAGHKQGLDVHIQPRGNGKRHRGIIAGSYYQHHEDYLTEQGNDHWRGVLMLNEVREEGDFDLVEASMGYMLRRWA